MKTIALLFALAGLSPRPVRAAAAPPQISTGQPRISFRIDPRIELLSVVERLGDPARDLRSGGGGSLKYAADADAFFEAFSTHPAVTLFKALRARGMTETAPAEILLRVSDPPALSGGGIPEEILEGAGGAAAVRQWLAALRDFARASRFSEFLRAEQPRYDAFLQSAREESSHGLDPALTAAYLGLPFSGRYRFILAPLLSRELDVSPLILSGPDGPETIIMRWPSVDEGGGTGFGFGFFGDTVAHELVHTVTNPLAPPFGARLAAAGVPAPPGCSAPSGDGWTSCLREYVVLALTLRASLSNPASKDYADLVGYYESHGFPLMGALTDRLKEFEADRKRYPTVGEFYPRLMEVFFETSGAAAKAPKATAESTVPSPVRTQPVETLNDKGVAAFQKGDVPAALRFFQAAVLADPVDVEARLNAAVAYERSGDTRRALQSYDAAVREGEADYPLSDGRVLADALSSRATLLEALKRLPQARSDLRRALAVAPADWQRRSETERRLAQTAAAAGGDSP